MVAYSQDLYATYTGQRLPKNSWKPPTIPASMGLNNQESLPL